MTERTGRGRLRQFWRDTRGSVAVIFAISAIALVAFLGAGLDLSRAYVARQQLSNVATMTCQYSTRPSVYQAAYGNSGVSGYVSQVNTFATQSLTNQKLMVTQTVSNPFSYAAVGSNGQVSLSANVPTLFLPIVSINNLPVNVSVTCAAAQSQTQQSSSSSGTVVLSESFENSACANTCWSTFQPNGTRQDPSPTTQNTFTTTVGYIGTSGAEWSIMGYCLEIDASGVIRSTSGDGSHAAELDCDNGSGSAGASSISNKTYYTAGTYELRYSFAGRVPYPDYDPTYICGSTAGDVSWANSSNGSIGGYNNIVRGNQVGVYLDADQSNSAPTHSSLAGVTLAGSNLIDVCVESTNWIQRSVTFTITTAGYYWLSFAADGANNSYGADIDAIQVCVSACTGSVTDPFPSAWTSTPLLFEDSFESPTTTGKVLDADAGTSNNGWPSQTTYYWATGPYDEVGIVRTSGFFDAGSQALELDNVAKSGSQTTTRRSISRYFFLDPGYYSVSYDYRGAFVFSSNPGTQCTYAPSTSTALSTYTPSGTPPSGKKWNTGSATPLPSDTNAVAVFMSQGLAVSYPTGAAGVNNASTYTNPSAPTSTTWPTAPGVAPDSVSTSTYNTAQLNPVLDYCNYAPSWTVRTTYFKITKSGQYWLTIGSVGAAASQDAIGGVIDDVKISAYNSSYSAAPSFYVTIPTSSPSSGTNLSFTGFTVVADPWAPS